MIRPLRPILTGQGILLELPRYMARDLERVSKDISRGSKIKCLRF